MASDPAPPSERPRRQRKHPFWDSEEGQRYKDTRRFVSTLRVSGEVEPRQKQGLHRKEADLELHDALLPDALLWHGLEGAYGGYWPRPRATLALDISLSTSRRNPPRIDKICKWLLDLLGSTTNKPLIYADDSQIKMLFARTSNRSDRPLVAIEAQTVSETLAGVRRAISLNPPWRPERANFDTAEIKYDVDPIEKDLASWYASDSSDFGKEWHLRLTFQERTQNQLRLLAGTDRLSAGVVIAYAHERETKRFRLPGTAAAIQALRTAPYVIDLGTLPNRGQSSAHIADVKARLDAHVAKFSYLYPLLSSVGVTLFYVESTIKRDLDNILLTLLPIVLDKLAPPSEGIHHWAPIEDLQAWESAKLKGERLAATGVDFLEAVAIREVDGLDLEPGTVLLALSPGARFESWWANANSYVEDRDRNRMFEDFDEWR